MVMETGKILGPGLYHEPCDSGSRTSPDKAVASTDNRFLSSLPDDAMESDPSTAADMSDGSDSGSLESGRNTPAEREGEGDSEVPAFAFVPEETLLVFDWDDTVLPSSWIQSQGLRLDDQSHVSAWQREQLNEIYRHVSETLRVAKTLGTVVLVTNAERGWIELSCLKFLPMLSPMLESIKLMSARTTYETKQRPSPLDWKVCAFQSETRRIFGEKALNDPAVKKNVLSLGDGCHEREALMRTTASLPNCRAKSLKFVERPDIDQICKQHTLVNSCFSRIVHHDGNLDLCINCS